jgi:cyclopropane-fatty-acyl-phospholipid synthase
MWDAMLDAWLSRQIRRGDLTLTLPGQPPRQYGDGGSPHVELTVTDPGFARRACLAPDLAVGEAYMDGTLTVAGDDLRGLFTLAMANRAIADPVLWQRPMAALRTAVRHVRQWNPAGRSRANVAHHYDLSAQLYDLFLDADRQYSCAYFERPDMTLDEAQAAKKAHIGKKLMLEPDMRVLDIGCGWGGLAITLARDWGARVTGITLSEEQHRLATDRVQAAGLSDRVEIRLRDYRAMTGTFDRVVSVGMFEHVGLPQYATYFRTIRDRLAPDGVALVHTIGRTARPQATSAWLEKYIFPGGYVPSLSDVVPHVEGAGLVTADIEVWRLHYAETLRHWHDRFTAREAEARTLYDDRFCRMWRYYLLACEMAFRLQDQGVFQIQLARRLDTVPLTRDYLYGTAPMATHDRIAAE